MLIVFFSQLLRAPIIGGGGGSGDSHSSLLLLFLLLRAPFFFFKSQTCQPLHWAEKTAAQMPRRNRSGQLSEFHLHMQAEASDHQIIELASAASAENLAAAAAQVV